MPPRATSESRPEDGAILRLLGGFELRRGGRPTAVGSRKARALLAYLAMRRGQPVARDGLTALLWPDTAPAAGRQSLRQALLLLRRALGPGGIESRCGGDLVLPRDPRLEVDVERFEQATRPTAFGHDVASESGTALAARLYRGELLAGIELADAGPFEEWLATERSRLCDLADQALAHLDRAAERRGDLRAAAQLAERRLQLDDLSEGAARRLAALLARGGLRSRALVTLERLAERLAAELGTPPEPATLLLAERLRAGFGPAELAPAGPAVASLRHVPVLPLLEREEALSSLAGVFARVARGESAVALLEGAGGAGKTRLARTAIAELLPDAGAWILPTCGCAADRPSEESALARLLEAGRRAPELAELAPLTCALRVPPDNAASRPGRAGRGAPRVLLIDDLDALPPSREAALGRLAAGLAHLGPVALLATARRPARARMKSLVGRLAGTLGAGATWVPIAPLGARSIARIAESIVEEGASALARWLRRATTGLPLELTEALALLGDLEALTPRADGSWDIDAAALDAVRTRGLPELVEARVARLPPCARRLLGLAAVAGPCFPLETLARAEGELEPVLASAVETLVERWFLRPLEERWHEADASAPEPGRARVFQFAQRTTRRLLLARIPAARRREMAHRIAAATRGSRRPEPSPVR